MLRGRFWLWASRVLAGNRDGAFCCLCFWRENDIPDLVGSLGDSDREEPRLVFFFFLNNNL